MVVNGGSKRLDFFQSSVMPLARKCDHLAAHSPLSERNFHRMCVVRLWELFPCFCASPDDIEEIFPSLSETLCKALEDIRYPELLVSFEGRFSSCELTFVVRLLFATDYRSSLSRLRMLVVLN